jgi:hypothetical protein
MSFERYNNQLYVAGMFTSVRDASNVSGLSSNYIARWDVSNNIWKLLGKSNKNGANNPIRTLELDYTNMQLYLGGDFTQVLDQFNTNPKYYNGSTNEPKHWIRQNPTNILQQVR